MRDTEHAIPSYDKPVYIVDGLRTPYLKSRGRPGPFAAADLAVYAGRELLSRLPIKPTDIGEVIVGSVMPSEQEANIARIISLRLGCGNKVPAWTVQRNCASGMQAIDSATKDIALGRYDLVLAGGTEAMSRAPLLYGPAAVDWFSDLNSAKTFSKKLKTILKFRPHLLKPIIALICGLTDPVVNLNMGQTAEIIAKEFGITRTQMDEFAARSHQRLAQATDQDLIKEMIAIYDDKGQLYAADDGLRRDSSVEKLAKLKPVFDKHFGNVTPGNSSQITDGATMLLLASESAIKRYQLPVLGRIVDIEWAALWPEKMGLGPIMAATPLLQRHSLKLDDIDYWEINEAFAAQVLGCIAAWQDDAFCREHLGLEAAFGALNQDRLNIDGGAVALGHPVGSSGARIVLHLLNVLKRKKAKRGVASICIGGGQGGAMLLESS